ncbi:MAG: serine/threonine-protein kinase, partial [Gemmatimonadota bacterium]
MPRKRGGRDTPKEILGRYHVESEIGAGMMGTVYRGRDTLIDRLVAIKAIRLPSGGSTDSDVRALRDRFLVEARAAGRLTHPNVVTLYDVAQEDDDFFLIFEFVEGKPLAQLLKKGKLDPTRCRRIALGAARGLAAAHAYGIVHRDIKPANLILSDGDEVKIADFGVARLEGSSLTQAGQTVGTPAYMSPEQAQGKALDGRSDVFSLGVVLYEMLTGTNPFAAANAPAAMLKIAYEEPPPLQ